jgi:diguanylate cyclase (GGDEF)-like protein
MSSATTTTMTALDETDDLADYRRRAIRLAGWAYLFCLALVAATSNPIQMAHTHPIATWAQIITSTLSYGALRWFPWRRHRHECLLVLVAVSVAQISGLRSVTGGDDSPFFPLYFFIIIGSGAYFRGMWLGAVVAWIVLGSMSYYLFERPIQFDFDHAIDLPLYIGGALVSNFLFRDLQDRTAQAQRQTRHLEALHEASRLLHAESSLSIICQRLLDVAQHATGARYAAIRTFDADGRLAEFFHAGLDEHTKTALKEPPTDIGILGAITVDHPTVRINDITTDPRHKGFPAAHPVMRSLLAVSVTSTHRLLGKLYLTEKNGGGPFTPEDDALLTALDRDAVLAIDHARLVETIESLAATDGLTGLRNRREFDARLRAELDGAARYGHPVSLVMVDVDNFKALNDAYGHPVGDAALQAIANALTRSVRTVDCCARYGGEEFAVILPHTAATNALMVAERMRAAVAAIPIPAGNASGNTLSISAGLAEVPTDARTAEQIIVLADAALYRAKRLGKNRVEAATDVPDVTAA